MKKEWDRGVSEVVVLRFSTFHAREVACRGPEYSAGMRNEAEDIALLSKVLIM